MNWQKIVIHHSASPTAVQRGNRLVAVDADLIREWHRSLGWSDISYHIVILPDGTTQNGRPLHRPGAHCNHSSRNVIGIGICLVGNFSELPQVPEAQFWALLNKLGSLMDEFQILSRDIELHREVPGAATECPGLNFPAEHLRREIAQRLEP